ncbi:hypothetical protein BRD56_01095 [Thermoplasmatales archaeon SW_10_69_26]|nr:MAG: hypothetical protein BRD56_01095 [Thermoplasmatales archaeon SW_10_69_26]
MNGKHEVRLERIEERIDELHEKMDELAENDAGNRTDTGWLKRAVREVVASVAGVGGAPHIGSRCLASVPQHPYLAWRGTG